MDLNDLLEALKANTAAITAHTKTLAALGGKAAAAPAAGAAAGAKAGDKKADAKAKVPSDDEMRAGIGEYIAASEDAADREVRRDNAKALLAHYEVAKATEIPKEKRAEALAYIKQFAAGETPDFMESGGGDSDDLLG